VQLANAGLDARGWETLLAYGQIDVGEAEAPLRGSIEARRIPGLQRKINPLADAHAFAGLLPVIRAFRPHIIHTHLSKAGLVGRSAGIGSSRAKRVHTFHGNVFDGYFSPAVSRAILGIERSLASHTHAVVALSESQRDELLERRIVSASRIHIVPLGIDLNRYRDPDRGAARRRLGIPPGAPIIVAVGRMVPIKRLDRLIGAMPAVIAAVPTSHLYLVGDGPDRAGLESQVRGLQLDGNVTFVGWSSESEDWYGAADVVALSSAREGTPLALIEAAAAGRPVVATSVGGVPDVVQNGITGIVLQSEDGAALSDAIIGLLSDPEKASRMGAAAAAGAQRFGADRLVDDLDHLYRSLLHDRRS
jgi:glycosyltransferase involved in cell wall biosynthesis